MKPSFTHSAPPAPRTVGQISTVTAVLTTAISAGGLALALGIYLWGFWSVCGAICTVLVGVLILGASRRSHHRKWRPSNKAQMAERLADTGHSVEYSWMIVDGLGEWLPPGFTDHEAWTVLQALDHLAHTQNIPLGDAVNRFRPGTKL